MLQFVLHFAESWPGLFVLCVCCGLIVPVPEDVVVVWAGLLIDEGKLDWGETLLAVCVGCYIRDIAAFLLGRWVGGWVLSQRGIMKLLGRRRMQRAHAFLEHRGSSGIFLGRFLVGMRVPVFFMAGSLGLSFRRFALADALGMLPSSGLLIWAGYRFGHPVFDTLRDIARGASWSVALLCVAGGLLAWRWLRKQPATGGEVSGTVESVPTSSPDTP